MKLMSMITPALLGFAGAIAGGIAGVLIATRDPETIAFGALAGIYLLPSIVLYVLLNRFVSGSLASHVAFWVAATVIAAYFFYVSAQSMSQGYDDGSGLMALHSAYGICGAALVSYAVLIIAMKA